MLAIFFKYEFYLINKMNILSNFTVKNFVYNFRFYKNFAISSNKNSDAKEIMIMLIILLHTSNSIALIPRNDLDSKAKEVF